MKQLGEPDSLTSLSSVDTLGAARVDELLGVSCERVRQIAHWWGDVPSRQLPGRVTCGRGRRTLALSSSS